MREMPMRPDGSLWSQHLESLLVPDREYLRLYDSTGQRCLTGEEAKDKQAKEEAEARRAETKRADAEASRAKALAEKLRALGIDPNQI